MFITFEGTDGSGKTTQIALLRERLERQGRAVLVTREPGGDPIAEAIRDILLCKENRAMEPVTEALLYAAARAQHVRQVILPALRSGRIVLCDRFYDSSIAYQAYGRQLGEDLVFDINRPALAGLAPDRTYLLMVGEQVASARQAHRSADRIEGEDAAFFGRVRQGFARVAQLERVCSVQADGDPQEIAQAIWQDIEPRLDRRPPGGANAPSNA